MIVAIISQSSIMFFTVSEDIWPAWTQTISWLIHKSNHESSKIIKFCQPLSCTYSKSLNNSFDRSTRICHCVSMRRWGTQCKCLITNPKDPIRRRQTVVYEIHVYFASLHTDVNEVSLRAWRIALSSTSGGDLDAVLCSEAWSLKPAACSLQPAARGAQVEGHRQVCYCIETKYPYKLIMDRLGRKTFPVEI
jgi:hypothetical protein